MTKENEINRSEEMKAILYLSMEIEVCGLYRRKKLRRSQ